MAPIVSANVCSTLRSHSPSKVFFQLAASIRIDAAIIITFEKGVVIDEETDSQRNILYCRPVKCPCMGCMLHRLLEFPAKQNHSSTVKGNEDTVDGATR